MWREPPFASKDKKFIYFPGKRDEEQTVNISYNLPKNCTIFMVVKFFDKVGLIYIKKDDPNDQYIFSLSQITIVDFILLKAKSLELRKQYSIVIEVKNHNIQRIRIVNDGTIEASKPMIIFDKLEMGRGHGLIYDLIIHDKLLEDEKIDEIIKSLNEIHKISS
jgi:hypothetical protein